MTWIRVDLTLPGHKKTRRLRRALEDRNDRGEPLPPVAAHDLRVIIGTLVLLWLRTKEQAPDGRFEDYTGSDLGELLEIGNAAEADSWIAHLAEAGWIETRPGGFEVPSWWDHNGQHSKDAERKRAERARKSAAKQGAGDSRPAVRTVPSVPYRMTDTPDATGRADSVRGRPRTVPDATGSNGQPPDGPDRSTAPQETGQPEHGREPISGTASQQAAPLGPRAALLAALGVPEERWAELEAFGAIAKTDTSLEALLQRRSLAPFFGGRADESVATPAPGPAMAPEGTDAEVLARAHALAAAVGFTPRPEAPSRGTEPPAGPAVQRVNRSAIHAMARKHPVEVRHTAVEVAEFLFARGVGRRAPKLLEMFVRWYLDHHAGIRNWRAYFNPQGPAFQFMHNRLAGDAAIEEHEELKRVDREWIEDLQSRTGGHS